MTVIYKILDVEQNYLFYIYFSPFYRVNIDRSYVEEPCRWKNRLGWAVLSERWHSEDQLDNAISTTFGIGRARMWSTTRLRVASSWGFDKLTFDRRNTLNSYSRFDVHGRFAGYANIVPTRASTMTKDSESYVRAHVRCVYVRTHKCVTSCCFESSTVKSVDTLYIIQRANRRFHFDVIEAHAGRPLWL